MAMRRVHFAPVHAVPDDWTVVTTGVLTSAAWIPMGLWLSSASAYGEFAVFPARLLRAPVHDTTTRGETAWGFSDPAMAIEFKMRFG